MYKKIYLELVVNPFMRCNENHLFTNGPKSNEWGVVTSQGKIPLLTNMGGPFFWHFPMCIVWRGLQRIIVYLNYLFTYGSKSNEWGWLSLQKEKFLCWSFSWHFPMCIVLWGLPRIIVYFKLYFIWVSSLIKEFFMTSLLSY